MKIYTKTGDKGSTSLFGGKRVGKDDPRLAAYGAVDELNSQIGVVLSELRGPTPKGVEPLRERNEYKNIVTKLVRLQGELFVLGWDLAAPIGVKVKVERVKKSYVGRLEKEIDFWEKKLPKIKNFILPGGGKVGAGLHLARTIARRAERELVSLSHEEKINTHAQVYLNRLSDWFFVLARYANYLEKRPEAIWRGR